jgi:hypothetical protein
MFIYALVTVALLSSGELEAEVSYYDTLAQCQALGAIEILTNPNLKFVGCKQALEA